MKTRRPTRAAISKPSSSARCSAASRPSTWACASSTTCPHRRPCSCGNDRATSSNSTPPGGWTGGEPRPKTPKDDRHVEGQGRTGLFGRRLLLDDLRTDYQPRRCQHGRPDGYGARTGRNRALQTRHRRKPPRDDVDRRQGGGRGHGVRHVQRIHQTHLRTARREQDHGQRRPTPRPTSKRPQRPSISSTPHGPKPPKS